MRLSVQNLGPIAEADVTFGDLTILVGPQATGKSIFLQTLHLVRSIDYIKAVLERNGYFWVGHHGGFLWFYYAEGVSRSWDHSTKVRLNEEEVIIEELTSRSASKDTFYLPSDAATAYIPAQRILTLQNGWSKPFSGFDSDDPFVLKAFSEDLRGMHDLYARTHSQNGTVNVQGYQRHAGLLSSIYQGGEVHIETNQGRLQYALRLPGNERSIPFGGWSSGQKEFLTLYLAADSYLPVHPTFKTDTIIIEEPEMGLHPKAIQAFLLLILELMHNGYKVILSTHSPVVLEMAWALRFLQKGQATAADVAKLFDVEAATDLAPLFERALTADVKVYYFDRTAEDGRVHARDISALDAESEDPGIADWGGLTAFADQANRTVAQVMARAL